MTVATTSAVRRGLTIAVRAVTTTSERRAAVFDIKWIRDNPEAFDAGLKKRGISPGGDVKFAAS